jgi:protein TonB
MDFKGKLHLNSKYHSMTNNHIHHSNFDDIIFENRNKMYGAYALRSGYNNRMLTAMGAGMSVILLGAFVFMNSGNQSVTAGAPDREEGLVIRQMELPKEKPVEPEKPKDARPQKPMEKTATVKYISAIKIEKEVKTEMAPVEDLEGKAIGDKNEAGKAADGTVVLNPEPAETGNGLGKAVNEQPEFIVQERSPEFPGGAEALKKFLSRNLLSPENLEKGEMKTVRIRFRVDKDGGVNGFDIMTSAGEDFDDEVVRVCRKMPRWIPALQNGVNVPVNYILPVTFVGSE